MVGASGEEAQASHRGQRPGQYFNSSALPRSSGTHTGKPLELCTSERPEGKESRESVE